MNISNISHLNSKYNIEIDTPSIQHFSGDYLQMSFDMYLEPNQAGYNRWVNVQVKANEPIYAAIERVLARLDETSELKLLEQAQDLV
jgi:hypothetical protein